MAAKKIHYNLVYEAQEKEQETDEFMWKNSDDDNYTIKRRIEIEISRDEIEDMIQEDIRSVSAVETYCCGWDGKIGFIHVSDEKIHVSGILDLMDEHHNHDMFMAMKCNDDHMWIPLNNFHQSMKDLISFYVHYGIQCERLAKATVNYFLYSFKFPDQIHEKINLSIMNSFADDFADEIVHQISKKKLDQQVDYIAKRIHKRILYLSERKNKKKQQAK